MYTGTNPTALRSQEMFMEALERLMRKKPLSAISVSELCKEADLSRQTFYLLFANKESILDLRFERVFKEYAQAILAEKHLTTRRVADWFVEFLEKEAEFIGKLVDNELTPIMLRNFRLYLGRVDDMLLFKEGPLWEYGVAFLAGALVEIAAAYVRDEAPPAGEQIAGLICEILTGRYFNMEERREE